MHAVTLKFKLPPVFTGCAVYRATKSGGPYTKIMTGTNTPVVDTNVIGGVTYYYVVTTLFKVYPFVSKESAYSNEVAVTVPV